MDLAGRREKHIIQDENLHMSRVVVAGDLWCVILKMMILKV